jgi:hypothetical protein
MDRKNGMRLWRLRKLAGLTETIADDPHTNYEIERRLQSYPAEMRIALLDALEIVKDAPNGLSAGEWAERIRRVHGEDEMPLGEVLSAIKRDFDFVVRKNLSGRWSWVRSDAPEADMDPMVRQALEGQVGLTHAAMEAMRAMGSFTEASLSAELSRRTHIPVHITRLFVQHLMQQFRSMIQPDGRGAFHLVPEPETNRDDTMSFLRSLADRKDRP